MSKTEVSSQYPGLYLFSGLARMVRPVINLRLQRTEMIGTFEQVYMDIAVTASEIHPGVSTANIATTVMTMMLVYDGEDYDDVGL